MIRTDNISAVYDIRRLNEEDIPAIEELCQGNPQFYLYSSARPDRDFIAEDMRTCPPGKTAEDKYYCGLFDENGLAGVLDLIDGYPDEETAFIGFFMLDQRLQGRGAGSAFIDDLCRSLFRDGFKRVRLCIDEGNPQSSHFWQKNGFRIIKKTISQYNGSVLLAERDLISEKE